MTTTSRVFRTRGGAPGRYGRRVAALLREHPEVDGLLGDLARDLADVVDAARRDQDTRAFTAGVDRLMKVLDQLGGGDDDDKHSARRGDAGELPPGLAAALGTGPDVGDASES